MFVPRLALRPTLYSTSKLTKYQMAKRMGFSVVGLPHYTIWHLYEPSLDDIRHMEVRFFFAADPTLHSDNVY